MLLAKGPVLLMTTICWKRLSFTQRMVIAPSSKIIWPIWTRVYFWLSFLFHWSICLTLCQWKWSASHSVVSDSSRAMDSTDHGIFQARILECVAVPVCRGFSHPRDQTQVSCITGGFFTSWATREARFMAVLLLFWSCSLVGGLQIRNLESSRFVVLFQDCLAIQGPLRFCKNFRVGFLLLQKSSWDFYRDFFCRLLWVILTF